MLNMNPRASTSNFNRRSGSIHSEFAKDDNELQRATTAAASVYSYKNSNIEKMLSSIGAKTLPFKVKLPKLPV